MTEASIVSNDDLSKAASYGELIRELDDLGRRADRLLVQMDWLEFRKQFVKNPAQLGAVVASYYSEYWKV